MENSSPVGTYDRKFLMRRAFQAAPQEACGFIMKDGRTIEIRNVALNSHNNFEMDRQQLVDKGIEPNDVAALWHTHPSGSTNPSAVDQRNMAALGESYGDWAYLIVTKDDVAQYNTATDWAKFV